ncbi:glycosyltransferase family 31 protein [Rutstroemia sp. NJR-2017a WRK4]|nr:glycosyltransferase family 31 protein [Rutstroemia sp. NJR-2017a WRK4]
MPKSPSFPIEIDDVGIIIKTGFSTREYLLAQSDILRIGHSRGNIVIVGDYSSVPGGHPSYDNLQAPVYDVLAIMIGDGSLSSRLDAARLQHYYNLTAVLSGGNLRLGREIGKNHRLQLDIMKHISGLELGYTLMPTKKWYIMLEDDTYILDASLKVILGHLDPSLPYYLGNAVGDVEARFAHGDSAVVLSTAAMHHIFIYNPEVVAKAHLESLDARWGDKLIATTAMESGIYLDEKYNRHFNGDAPRATRIQEDRFCVPIVSFHEMTLSQISDFKRIFKNAKTVLWMDLWKIYSAPSLDTFLADPFRSDWDHVGRPDEATMTVKSIRTKEDCLRLCRAHSSACLAWTWEVESFVCHIAPWMTVGYAEKGRFSGVNAPRAISLSSRCPAFDGERNLAG